MALATETEIQGAYEGKDVASRYVDERFRSEVHRLLHDRQVAAIQRAIGCIPAGRVLEIAPGPGRLTRQIRPSGSLVCLEYNEGMVERGRQASAGKALWVRGNGFQLPFAEAFDLVYTFRFVRHFRRADRDRLYGEVRRVLKPGGYFLLDAVNDRISRPLRAAHPEEYPIYDKLYQAQELRDELRGAGLPPLSLEPVQKFMHCQGWSQTYLGPRWNWLNRLIVRCLERLPRREGLEWIVTCRRL